MINYSIDYIKDIVTVSGTGKINKDIFQRECCNSQIIFFDGIFYVESFEYMFSNFFNLRIIQGYENIYARNNGIIGLFMNCDNLDDFNADEVIRHVSLYAKYDVYKKRIHEQEMDIKWEILEHNQENNENDYNQIEERYGYDDDAIESSPEYWEDIYDKCN